MAVNNLRCVVLNQEQKLHSLAFLRWTNQYFCFSKNHSQSKPVEQLLSLNGLIQQNIDDAYTDDIAVVN